MAKLRVGIVGAGHVADLHARGYQHDDRAQIVAVCDPNEDAAIKHALAWGARAYYADFDALLADPQVDAIELLSPNAFHAPQALRALQAGKHVCIERPMATSLRDADALIAAAQASGKILQVYEPLLTDMPLLEAQHLIDAGEIGQLTGMRVHATLGQASEGGWSFDGADADKHWRFDPAMSGGTPLLYEVAYQAFCAALFLVGSVERVEAWAGQTKLAHGALIDAPASAMWKHFQQECFGTLSLTYAPERKMRTDQLPIELSIIVSGTRGELHIWRSPDAGLMDAPLTLRRNNQQIAHGQKRDSYGDSFTRATQSFISACLGEGEPLLRGVEARQILVLTMAYFESIKRGRAISLKHA